MTTMIVLFLCLLTGAVVALFAGHTRLGVLLALGVGILIGNGTATDAVRVIAGGRL
jgi:hypothetical protein